MLFWKGERPSGKCVLACVSILILLDVILEVVKRRTFCLFFLVSILILLDVILEVLMSIRFIFCLFCFNPYSVGCYSGRQHLETQSRYVAEFQSLFCWMLFWKILSYNQKYFFFLVSILILLDVILEVPRRFFGMAAWNSFNPYSVGCYSGRISSAIWPGSPILFQSLFCWMLFWKVVLCVFVLSRLFVSILILLDVILEVSAWRFSRFTISGFNPYSVGCYSGSN